MNETGLYLLATTLLWSVALGLLLIVVFPSIVGRLREATIAAAINRSILFPDTTNEAKFGLLQLRALIYDCVGLKDGITLRLSKLREVYLAMDNRGRESRFAEAELERYGRKCLQELVGIIAREIGEVRPNVRLDGPIIYAKEILALIANRDLAARAYPAVHQASELEMHFRDFPLTVEQIGELLEATSYGLLFRKEAPSGMDPDDFSLLTELIRREQRLRALVENRIRLSAIFNNDVVAILKACIGVEAVEQAIERAERSGHTENLFEGLFLDQLKQIIAKRWDLFKDIFVDRKKIMTVFEEVAPVRNNLAHGRRLTSQDRNRAKSGCYQIDAWLEEIP